MDEERGLEQSWLDGDGKLQEIGTHFHAVWKGLADRKVDYIREGMRE